MTDNWYEYAKNLFAEDPAFAGVVLRECLEADLPPGLPQAVITPLAIEERLGDPPPDALILAGRPTSPVRAIIVEFMATRDDGRRRRWPLFAAAVWASHQCPVDILAVCPDDQTARWCAEPITTTLRGFTCHPKAVSLSRIEELLPTSGA